MWKSRFDVEFIDIGTVEEDGREMWKTRNKVDVDAINIISGKKSRREVQRTPDRSSKRKAIPSLSIMGSSERNKVLSEFDYDMDVDSNQTTLKDESVCDDNDGKVSDDTDYEIEEEEYTEVNS